MIKKSKRTLSPKEYKKEHEYFNSPVPLEDDATIATVIPLLAYTKEQCLLYIGNQFEGEFRRPKHAEDLAFRDFGVDEVRIFPSLYQLKEEGKI